MPDDSYANLQQTILSPVPLSRSRRRRNLGLGLRLVLASGTILGVSIGAYPLLPRSYTAWAGVLVQLTNPEGAPSWQQTVQYTLDDNAIQTKIDLLYSKPMQLVVIQQNDLMHDSEYNKYLRLSWWRKELLPRYPWLADWVPETHNQPDAVASILEDHLNVVRERKSYLLKIGYESSDPAKAARLTNTLVNQFVAAESGRQLETHAAVVKALRNRMTQLEKEYQSSESEEHKFIYDHKLEHTGDNTAMQQELSSIAKQVGEVHQKVINLRTRAQVLTDAVKQGKLLEASNEVINSPTLQHLRERYLELSTGLGSASTMPIGANTQVLAAARTAIQVEAMRLVVTEQNDLLVAKAEEAALRSEVTRIDQAIAEWNDGQHAADEYRRLTVAYKTALDEARNRYFKALTSADEVQPDITIVSSATTPLSPIFPSPKMYAIGTLFVLILVNGLLFLPRLIRRLG